MPKHPQVGFVLVVTVATSLNTARTLYTKTLNTGNAFNLIKDMVATISKASFNKQVDRDAPLQRVGLRDIDNVVGLGSSTKADGTKVDVYGVTMKKTT